MATNLKSAWASYVASWKKPFRPAHWVVLGVGILGIVYAVFF